MALQYSSIRATASALIIAAAVGVGGMTGMTSVLAADPPSTVAVSGTLVDGAGARLGGIQLMIQEELAPDGGIAAFQAITAADGTFAADVLPWGTAEAPVNLKIATAPDQLFTVVGEDCSQSWTVELDNSQQLALADATPAPLELVATTALVGEICGTSETAPPATTATPRPPTGTGNAPRPAAGLTPPPTDGVAAPIAASTDRVGPALTSGFLAGLLMAAALLLPRSSARRRG